MSPAVDDYDDSYDALDDALNEELSAIESDLIRLNSRSWPKPEDGEDARGSRRFRDGAEAERAEVGALDGREDGAVEAAAWMTRAEDAMVRGAREEGAVSTGTASGSFARAETRLDADADADADERDIPQTAPRRASWTLVFLLVCLALSFVAFSFNRGEDRLLSPMRVVEKLAYRGATNRIVAYYDPARVVEMQRKYIETLMDEKVVLIERLRRARRIADENRESAQAWRRAYVDCRANKNAFAEPKPIVAKPHDATSWSPAWSWYAHPRSKSTVKTVNVIRRFCPIVAELRLRRIVEWMARRLVSTKR